MKMIDLGVSMDGQVTPAVAGGDKYYPSLYLDERQTKALDIGDLGIGDTFTMQIEVRISRVSETIAGGKSTDFEIVKGAVVPPEKDRAQVLYGEK
jgi:hypothetical protein